MTTQFIDGDYSGVVWEYISEHGSVDSLKNELLSLIDVRIANLKLLANWIKTGKKPSCLGYFTSLTEYAQWLTSEEKDASRKTIFRTARELDLRLEGIQ